MLPRPSQVISVFGGPEGVGGSVTSLATVVVLSAALAGPEGTAALCLVRPEDQGLHNILAVRVHAKASQDSRFHEIGHLLGGEKVCISLKAGSWALRAMSADLRERAATDETKCQSNVLHVRLRAGKTRTAYVRPKAQESTYLCAWELQ